MENSKIKYNIVFLINGEAGKYHQDLMKTIGPKFGEYLIFNKKELSHITLKKPFFSQNISEVELLINKFVQNKRKSKIKFIGFDNSKDYAISIKTIFNTIGIRLQKSLIEELTCIKSIYLDKEDYDWKPHATITCCENKDKYKKIWDYLQNKKVQDLDLVFDNIAILKKTNGHWEIHKIFQIK